MIEVKKIPHILIEHFTPENESLGLLNDAEALDLRVQIAEQKLDGYYAVHNGEILTISTQGEYSSWPKEFHMIMGTLYTRLIKARRKGSKENTD